MCRIVNNGLSCKSPLILGPLPWQPLPQAPIPPLRSRIVDSLRFPLLSISLLDSPFSRQYFAFAFLGPLHVTLFDPPSHPRGRPECASMTA